jgi:hypothetical protein
VEQHFRERLRERYDLAVTDEEYAGLSDKFHGIFKKNNYRTVGYVVIEGKTVWCLYFNSMQCMATCYAEEMIKDEYQLLRVCFGRALLPIATKVYEAYLREVTNVPLDFGTTKEAAIFYFSYTLFPTLHIDRYKYGNVYLFKIMNQVKRVLENTSPYIELTVLRKQNKYEKLIKHEY